MGVGFNFAGYQLEIDPPNFTRNSAHNQRAPVFIHQNQLVQYFCLLSVIVRFDNANLVF
jgi:hypothetical protein